jgi:predicted permease
MAWVRRLLNLVRAARVGRDHEREIAFHLAERTDALIAQGWSEAEARREARRRFGDPTVVRERMHDADVVAWLSSLLADLRYAVRALARTPGFTGVAVLSLGLGIGANTAIFSLINAVLLRSVPVRHPEQLVRISMPDYGSTFTNPLWEAIRDRQEALAGVLAFADQTFNLAAGGAVRRTTGAWVSGDYFRVLGVGGAVGRVLAPADDVRGCGGVAVISHAFWQREYGGSADIVGRSIRLNGHALEIVGVADPGFAGIHVGRAANVFVPLCTGAFFASRPGVLDARSTWYLNVLGRLRPGQALADARARLGVGARGVFEASVPTHWTDEEQQEFLGQSLIAEPAPGGLSLVRGQYRDALFVLLLVVGVVLLIACANVAQLLLARATARRHEFAVRLAIGASVGRLARQLLTESLVLAFSGAAVGIVFARWASGLLVTFLADGRSAVSLDLSLDLPVLGFAAAVALATGVLFGLAPAWGSASVHPQTAMRGAGRGLAGGRPRLAKGMVVAQVALSLVLVMSAGLLLGTFGRLTTLDAGFQREDVLLVTADWSSLDLPDERQAAFPRELLERVRAIPGVRTASASLTTPISGSSWNENVVVDGFTPEGPRDNLLWFNAVTDGYLATLGTALLAGRDLTDRDGTGAPPVVLINQTAARRFFGDASPLGKHLRVEDHGEVGAPIEIVGVMRDAKYRRLDEETLATAFVPLAQTALWHDGITLALRTDGAPTAQVHPVTAAMREVSPAITLDFTTFDAQVARSLARPRLLATLSAFFGGLALLLAVMGLYGTMAYSVARRRNEIGLRMALGAARLGVVRMVAGEAGRMVVLGLLLGTGLAIAATRLVAGFLYGVTPTDPMTLGISAMVLALVAIGAGLVPAWRAARVDPMAALRDE